MNRFWIIPLAVLVVGMGLAGDRGGKVEYVGGTVAEVFRLNHRAKADSLMKHLAGRAAIATPAAFALLNSPEFLFVQ